MSDQGSGGASSAGAVGCPLCGAARRQRLFDVGDGYGLSACRECGVAFTDPPVPAGEVFRFYPEEYYGALNRRFHPVLERAVAFFRSRRARKIARVAPPGRVLDVGCGRGLLLGSLRDAGWQTTGVELSETAARSAREVLGLEVVVGDLLTAPLTEGAFDVVILWHVLEHLPAPSAALERCAALLCPGGLLVVAVPNFASLQARLTGRSWFHLDVPRHYVHLRLSDLERLLGRHGFRVQEVSHVAFEQNPYGWIQSVLNLVGLPRNLLYDVLKSRSARVRLRPWKSHPLAFAATLLALAPVGLLSIVLSALEVLLRRGGTVEVYARREPAGPRGARSRADQGK